MAWKCRSKFVSELWRIHPFAEGNTRTTAVFAIKYLRMLGFDVDNSIFEAHSRFFRDALVRANYANIRKGIYEDRDPLDDFFSDLMLGTRHDFHSRNLHIYADNAKLETKNIDTSIMEMMKKNRHITRQEIAATLGVSVKTVERHLKNLPNLREIQTFNCRFVLSFTEGVMKKNHHTVHFCRACIRVQADGCPRPAAGEATGQTGRVR